ncbi:MAG TPA: hypothetical protein VMT53_02945 [Terriglobales bacterium]|nr:hypothetical protein [Terriglobales bacterium]
MLVLIFAAGSFLVFIAILACLFVAHTLESREITRKRYVWTHRPVCLLSVTQAFEPIYAPLWEAPIAALQLVNSAATGIAVTRLLPIFRRASATFPEIYDGCEFVQWLQFLECEGLVCWRPEYNKVTITEKGKEFLANRFVSDALLEA